MRAWPGASTGSRSSSAERMSRMSISMCENDGVPEREDDVAGRGGVRGAVGELEAPRASTRSSSLLGPSP